MLEWFAKKAPIRTKLFWLTMMVGVSGACEVLLGAASVWQIVPPLVGLGLAAVVALVVVGAMAGAANQIATPYVSIVERLEGLAAGDRTSPVDYTDHEDCVGRIARATLTFRDQTQDLRQSTDYRSEALDTLKQVLGRLAAKDLDCQITHTMPGEFEQLRQDFNAAVRALAEALSAVSTSAQSVLNGANEIRSASDDLSSRNEQQAATLEETSAAMNEVTDGVTQSAAYAQQVRRSIDEAHKEAGEGGQVVNRAVEAMAGIERSSQEISQIINVIDGIAFQTNLLALNAGVEAARAGDAGKGFAVVANEVRALAQRSAEAAKDIKALITASSEQVSHGVGLVGETGTLLGRIVARVGEVSGLMEEIVVATQAQASNIVSINKAVGDMDRATQQNAAMVEQSNAASRSLANEARELSTIVGTFRGLGHTDMRAPAPQRSHAPISLPAAKARPAAVPANLAASSAPAAAGNLALSSAPSPSEDWSEF